MSSAKRFEKTFSRKKDNNNGGDKDEDDDDDLDQVICSLPAKRNNPNPNQKRKNVANSSSNLKQKQPKPQNPETQKPKRKVENGEGHTEVVKKKKKNTQIQKEEEEKAVKKVETSECTFPTARISKIIKSEGSDYRLSHETVFLINKATEKFIELFSSDAYDCAVEEHKSYIAYKHLSKAINQEKRFDFLSDFVPEKVTAEKALAERKPTET